MSTQSGSGSAMVCLMYRAECSDPARGCDLNDPASCVLPADAASVSYMPFASADGSQMRLCVMRDGELLGATPDAAAVCHIQAPLSSAAPGASLCGPGMIPTMDESTGALMCMSHHPLVAHAGGASVYYSGAAYGYGTPFAGAATTLPAAQASSPAVAMAAQAQAQARQAMVMAQAAQAAQGQMGRPQQGMAQAAQAAQGQMGRPPQGMAQGVGRMVAQAQGGQGPDAVLGAQVSQAVQIAQGMQGGAPVVVVVSGAQGAQGGAHASPEQQRQAAVASAREAVLGRMRERQAAAVSQGVAAPGPAQSTNGMPSLDGTRTSQRIADMPDPERVAYPPFGRPTDSLEERLRLSQHALATVATAGVL